MILPVERRRALAAKAQSYAATVDEVQDYLLSRGISLEVANMFGLGGVPRDDPAFASRLSIPYTTPAGVVQIKYRCTRHDVDGKHVDKDCPKYLYEAGTGTYLYNAQVLIHASETVVVTEGEIDAICIQAYTGLPAVAYPGADTWGKQKHWRLCFEGVSEVVVVADGDKPGKQAARRVADSIGMHARVVELPAEQDSNSVIASEGAGSFLERIR